MKKLIFCLFVLVLAAILSACGGDGGTTPPPPPAEIDEPAPPAAPPIVVSCTINEGDNDVTDGGSQLVIGNDNEAENGVIVPEGSILIYAGWRFELIEGFWVPVAPVETEDETVEAQAVVETMSLSGTPADSQIEIPAEETDGQTADNTGDNVVIYQITNNCESGNDEINTGDVVECHGVNTVEGDENQSDQNNIVCSNDVQQGIDAAVFASLLERYWAAKAQDDAETVALIEALSKEDIINVQVPEGPAPVVNYTAPNLPDVVVTAPLDLGGVNVDSNVNVGGTTVVVDNSNTNNIENSNTLEALLEQSQGQFQIVNGQLVVQDPPVQDPPVQDPPVQDPPVQDPPVEQPPVAVCDPSIHEGFAGLLSVFDVDTETFVGGFDYSHDPRLRGPESTNASRDEISEEIYNSLRAQGYNTWEFVIGSHNGDPIHMGLIFQSECSHIALVSKTGGLKFAL